MLTRNIVGRILAREHQALFSTSFGVIDAKKEQKKIYFQERGRKVETRVTFSEKY